MKTLVDYTKTYWTFSHYKDGNLWYISSDYFQVPIPVEEVGNGMLGNGEKGIVIMKWIRRQLQVIKDAQGE